MAKVFQAQSFTCPHCSAVLRLRERRFVGREINCPDCNQIISITTDHEDRVVVRAVDSPAQAPMTTDSQIRITPEKSAAKSVLLKLLTVCCWCVIFALGGLLLIGFLANGSPESTAKPVVEKTEAPVKPEQPEPKTELFPEVAESPTQEPAELIAVKPVSNWKFSGLPAVKAERPVKEAPVYPARWSDLMTSPILEYRVEAIPLPSLLQELEQLAGTEFQYMGEGTQEKAADNTTEVSFLLQSTNFALILEETLAAANLEFQLNEDQIVIQPKAADVLP